MKRVFLVGVLAGAVAVGSAFAGPAAAATDATGMAARATAVSAAAQAGSSERLATVRIPRAVTADGQRLPAGTYTLVLGELAPPPESSAPEGAQPTERWVQFEQRGQTKGREIASVVGADKIKDVAEAGDKIPASGRASVEMLKGGEYLRVWVNKGGESYLIHLPVAH